MDGIRPKYHDDAGKTEQSHRDLRGGIESFTRLHLSRLQLQLPLRIKRTLASFHHESPGSVEAQGLLQGSLNKRANLVKKKLRILGVDDEPVIGESIAYALEAPHRKIVVAKDGQEALALAKKQKFDVIITDHRMPRAGGLELVRKLRQRNYEGKIVVLSAHLAPENIGIYEALDIDEVIAKPIDSAELRELIEGLEEEV